MATLNGKGIVQLPDFYVASSLTNGTLVELLAEYRCEREPVWALYPQNRHLSPKVKLAIEFLSERLSQGTFSQNNTG